MVSAENLKKNTVKELKQICRDNDISGYSGLRKAQIIQLIIDSGKLGDGGGQNAVSEKELKKRIKSKKVYSREKSEKKIKKNKQLMANREQIAKKSKTQPKGSQNKSASNSSRETHIVSQKKITKIQPLSNKKHSPSSEKNNQSKSIEEPKSRSFYDLPTTERNFLLQKISKKTRKLLKHQKRNFKKMKEKKLEKILDILEIEKGRFTVYNPSDKLIRGLIDESISLINEVREEKLNELEHHFLNEKLPKKIDKKKGKILKIINRIDKYYTELDAARDIVNSIKMKSPFPDNYWVSVISTKIKEEELFS